MMKFDKWVLEIKRLMYENNWDAQAIEMLNDEDTQQELREDYYDVGDSPEETLEALLDQWRDSQ